MSAFPWWAALLLGGVAFVTSQIFWLRGKAPPAEIWAVVAIAWDVLGVLLAIRQWPL